MKRTIIILFIVIGLTNSYGQELNGVWMSYNNRRIDPNKNAYGLGMHGLILDFQKLEFGHYLKDTVMAIKPNFRKHKIKTEIAKRKLRFKAFGKDSLEIDFEKKDNVITVFRPLDLSHKLEISESELADFLVISIFEPLKPIEFDFTNEPDYFEKISDKPKTKKRFLNSSRDHPSYWFLKEIIENYFLIVSLDVNSENIYQIISISDIGIVLKPLQEDYPLTGILGIKTGLLELKTSL